MIEAAPGQRIGRIVLRETCLMDHLCGGARLEGVGRSTFQEGVRRW